MRIFVDLETATYGDADNVVVLNVDPDEFENCTDSEIVEAAREYLANGYGEFI